MTGGSSSNSLIPCNNPPAILLVLPLAILPANPRNSRAMANRSKAMVSRNKVTLSNRSRVTRSSLSKAMVRRNPVMVRRSKAMLSNPNRVTELRSKATAKRRCKGTHNLGTPECLAWAVPARPQCKAMCS